MRTEGLAGFEPKSGAMSSRPMGVIPLSPQLDKKSGIYFTGLFSISGLVW